MAKVITRKQKKIILITLASITILYLDLACILKPQIGNLQKISSRLGQARVSLSQYKKGSSEIRALERALDSLKAKYALPENKIFSELEVTALLDDISKKALDSGLKIMQIKPRGLADDKEKEIIDSAGLRLLPLMLKLELSCGYHQLGNFLSQVEKNPLISVSELRLRPDSSEFTRQKIEITFKIYVSEK